LLKKSGFDSMDEFNKHAINKTKKDRLKGLAVIGGAVLLAILLTKK
jgi:uncharacterized CHY-type Zn-finger protein